MVQGRERDRLVIALTGPVGAGVSTVAKLLAKEEGFSRIRISGFIRAEWMEKENIQGSSEPTEQSHPGLRRHLQEIGDERRKENANYWMEKAFENPPSGDLVIDAVRNMEEVRWLIDRFSRFFLIAVFAPQEVRWERVKKD